MSDFENNKNKGINTLINIIHADDIFNYYKTQALWYVCKLWWDYFRIWSNLIKNESAWWDCAEELIQARHYLMGLTSVLKEFYSWDDAKGRPLIERDDTWKE